MKSFIILMLKGFLVGIGKIIPGVSGAVIAISLGIYEKSLKIIGNIFNNWKQNLKFLMPIGLGFAVSVIFFSKIIVNMLNNYYLPTMLLFIGLIIGSLKEIKNGVKLKNNIFLFLIVVILITTLSFVNFDNSYQYNFFVLILMGIVEAISMIVPGLSGTALLMMFGYYNLIMESFSNINISILFPFFIGVIIGIVTFSKIISYCFIHYENKTRVVVYGLTISSILILFFDTLKNNYSLSEIIVSLFLFFIGYKITKVMEK